MSFASSPTDPPVGDEWLSQRLAAGVTCICPTYTNT